VSHCERSAHSALDKGTQFTYVLVDAATNPPPAVDSGVLRIRHVGACIETPRSARFAADLPPAAEEGPNSTGATRVSLMVLLFQVNTAPTETFNNATYNIVFVNQRKHGLRIAVNDKRAVELVRQHGGLLGRHRHILLARSRRRLEVAEILPLEEVEVATQRWRGQGRDGRQGGGEQQGETHFGGEFDDDGVSDSLNSAEHGRLQPLYIPEESDCRV
jgi:hypothetical protein